MSSYLYPIESAALHFLIISFALTIPYMIYCYRKYGAVSIWRSAVLFSFLLYMLCAYYLVILPLPDPEKVAHSTGSFVQLIPFQFIASFVRGTTLRLGDPGTYIGALKQSVFIQPLFNVLLTVPFGAYLAYYFRQSVRRTILLTFLLSLFYELTQLTGLYGIYARPYRLFDVDDLMLNTLGGYLGYWVGARAAVLLPSKQRIDEKSLRRSEQVSYTRRFFALCADGVFLIMLTFIAALVGLGNSPYTSPVLFALYFVVLQSLLRGRTPGSMIVRIRATGIGTRVPLPFLLAARYGILAGAYLILREINMASSSLVLVLLCALAVPVFTACDALYSRTRGKRLWYERLSHTGYESYLDVEKILRRRDEALKAQADTQARPY